VAITNLPKELKCFITSKAPHNGRENSNAQNLKVTRTHCIGRCIYK